MQESDKNRLQWIRYCITPHSTCPHGMSFTIPCLFKVEIGNGRQIIDKRLSVDGNKNQLFQRKINIERDGLMIKKTEWELIRPRKHHDNNMVLL